MDDQDKPPLIPYVYEEIAKSLHEVSKRHWSVLSELRVPHPAEPAGRAGGPSPPRLPEHLRIALCSYARELFNTEANEYPVSPRIEHWLSKLAERVTERVLRAVDSLDDSILTRFFGGQKYGLTWHGLTREEMRKSIQDALDEMRTLTLVRYQSVIEQNTDTLEPQPPITESSPSSNLDERSPAQIPEMARLVEHRKKLLEEYKAATGNPPNQRIYGKTSAGIYKPQFYEWRDGRLPEKSKITKRFERFLKAKRLPVPKNSTS